MAFGFAPAKAIEAYRISRLPVTDSADQVAAAQAGEELLFTAVLSDNPARSDRFDFVAYSVEEWKVTVPSDDSDDAEPSGHWETVEHVVPALNVELQGQPVLLQEAQSVRLGGNLHIQIVKGNGPHQAEYEGESLPEGTRRYRGLTDGDLVTIVGKKSTTGGVLPSYVFAGDRVQFEQAQRQEASGLFMAGLCLMGFAPIILLGGLLFRIFRK